MVKVAQASSLSDFSIERPTLIKNVVPPATVPSQQAAKAALRAARKTGTGVLPGILLASRTA
jgi:hypothetical protein